MDKAWKPRFAGALCFGAGVAASAVLHWALHQPTTRHAPPAPVKVSVRLQAAPPVPVARVVATDAVLPLKTEKPVAPKQPKKPPAPKPPADIPTDVASEAAPPLPTIAQPSLAVPTLSSPESSLPLIVQEQLPLVGAAEDAPTVPAALPPLPSVLASLESPGGPILVIAALVNDAGVVVDSTILVPSRAALKDVTLTLSLVGTTWQSIDPPMLPGELRWFELRIDHSISVNRQLILP